MVYGQYLAAVPNLDIEAVIRREICWPKEVKVSLKKVAVSLNSTRTFMDCYQYWHAKGDPSLIFGKMTPMEMNLFLHIMAEEDYGDIQEAVL